jgi:hypothetical protein
VNIFLQSIPALLGVVIGIAATSWSDRSHWERNQAVRWDEQRIQAYADYAKAIKRIHMIALRIVRLDRDDNITIPIHLDAAIELITEAEAQRTEAWELMLLLSDQETAYAALKWHTAVRREAEFARRHPDSAGSNDWTALVQNVDQARDFFYKAARNSVNVGGGSVEVAELRARNSAQGETASHAAPSGQLDGL